MLDSQCKISYVNVGYGHLTYMSWGQDGKSGL